MSRILNLFRNHKLFTIAFTLALLTSLFVGSFNLKLVNWEIIITLFGMMLVLGVFQVSGVLREVARWMIDKSGSSRPLVRNLVFLSFFISFILTNDVAVLTILPLYLAIINNVKSFKGSLLGAVLVVVAANKGGVLFPFSNPQNLVIYNYYGIDNLTFISWTIPMLIAGLILLLILCQKVEDTPIQANLDNKTFSKPYVIFGSIGLFAMILGVFGVFNVFYITPIIAIFLAFINIKFFMKVDYALLGVFASFFIIVGNISSFEVVRIFLTNLLTTPLSVYFTGLGFSQFISNVPATILLTPFTDEALALLWGTNIGGMGTLIASIANLIGYNIYQMNNSKADTKDYLILFTKVNILFIVIFSVLALIILQLN